MKNNFDRWNELKKKSHELTHIPHFSSSEIWWAQFGQNIATEIAGKGQQYLRPGLIIKCLYHDACLIIPLTSKQKVGSYHFNFTDSLGKKQCATLAQARYIDARRLKYKLSSISCDDFERLKVQLIEIIK